MVYDTQQNIIAHNVYIIPTKGHKQQQAIKHSTLSHLPPYVCAIEQCVHKNIILINVQPRSTDMEKKFSAYDGFMKAVTVFLYDTLGEQYYSCSGYQYSVYITTSTIVAMDYLHH